MPACCIINCGIRKLKNQPSVSVHRFPSNKTLRQKWIDIVGIANINTRIKDWYICSNHFEETCFNKTLDVIRVRDGAMPSSHLVPTEPRPKPICQRKRKNETSGVLCERQNIPKYTSSVDEWREEYLDDSNDGTLSEEEKNNKRSLRERRNVSTSTSPVDDWHEEYLDDSNDSTPSTPSVEEPEQSCPESPNKSNSQPTSSTKKMKESYVVCETQNISTPVSTLDIEMSDDSNKPPPSLMLLVVGEPKLSCSESPIKPNLVPTPRRSRAAVMMKTSKPVLSENQITNDCERCADSARQIIKKNDKIKFLRERLVAFRKKVKCLKNQVKRRDDNVAAYYQTVQELEAKLIDKEETLKKFTERSDAMEYQIAHSRGSEKAYSEQIKQFAMTLYTFSPKAYDFVRETYKSCLPSARTLYNWKKDTHLESMKEAIDPSSQMQDASDSQLTGVESSAPSALHIADQSQLTYVATSIRETKKKIRLQMLSKRIDRFSKIIQHLHKTNLITEEQTLDLKNILKKPTDQTLDSNGLEKTYLKQIRLFAVTLYSFSPKAYNFIRKTYKECLPMYATLAKWIKNTEHELRNEAIDPSGQTPTVASDTNLSSVESSAPVHIASDSNVTVVEINSSSRPFLMKEAMDPSSQMQDDSSDSQLTGVESSAPSAHVNVVETNSSSRPYLMKEAMDPLSQMQDDWSDSQLTGVESIAPSALHSADHSQLTDVVNNSSIRQTKKTIRIQMLSKKIAHLSKIIQHLQKTNLITEEQILVLKNILKKQTDQNLDSNDLEKTYLKQIRLFAVTLYSFSSKVYSFIRRTYKECLPLYPSLSKWIKNTQPEIINEAVDPLGQTLNVASDSYLTGVESSAPLHVASDSHVTVVETNSSSSPLKIKTRHQMLSEKIALFSYIIQDLQKTKLLNNVETMVLKKIAERSDVPKKHIKQSIEVENKYLEKVYFEKIRQFAETIYAFSPRAYNFVRKTYKSCLPHPNTLSRWDRAERTHI